MKEFYKAALAVVMVSLFCSACGDDKPPVLKTMTDEEVAPAVETAFQERVFEDDPGGERQDALSASIAEVVADFNKQDYPSAMMKAEQISSIPDLSEKQRETLNTVMVTITQRLIEARAAGNKDAEAFMEIRAKTK